MAPPRNDGRTRAPDIFGKPKTSFPEGSPDHPQIVIERNSNQDTPFKKFLDTYGGKWARALLTSQGSSPGDSNDANYTEKYETLPGAIFVDTHTDASGIPMLVARRRRAANDLFACGAIIPSAINIQSISITGSDGTVLINLASNHNLPPTAWITLTSTGSTPAINGSHQITSVPSDNQIRVTATVTVAGGVAGTMQAINRITRERRATENVNVFVQVDTMAACPAVSAFNQIDVPCRKVYPFPDYLVSANGYRDTSTSFSTTTGTTYALATSNSWSGGVTLNIQNGSRNQCEALRSRAFFMGPPPRSFFDAHPSTIVIPSSGTILIQSGAMSWSFSTNGTDESNSWSLSHSFRGMNIPPVLTGPTPGVTAASIANVAITSISTPASGVVTVTTTTSHGFAVGDAIRFTGTNSTPTLDGYNRVDSVPSTTTFTVRNSAISGAGTAAGTVARASQSNFTLDIPLSTPTHFEAGEIINVVDEPVRLDAGEIYVVDLWKITVPYDSGSPPP